MLGFGLGSYNDCLARGGGGGLLYLAGLEERETFNNFIFPSFSMLSLSSSQARQSNPPPSSPVTIKAL